MGNAMRDYGQFIDEIGLVLPDGETLEALDLAALVITGESLKSSASWLMGDVCQITKERYGDEWYSHLDMKLSVGTLNNYSSICGKFPRNRRRKSLSFRHHAAVGKLSEDEQNIWLDRAEKQDMSSDELREAIKAEVPTETIRKSEILTVGSIDASLIETYGLKEGFEVRVVFEMIKPKNVVNLVQPAKSEAA